MPDNTPIPLTKTLSLEDFDQLPAELAIVDAVGIDGQDPMRRWEYAMGLHAIRRWTPTGIHVADVGGAGSGFCQMLGRLGYAVTVIDPAINCTLETYPPPAVAGTFDAIFAISVLEHVDRWRGFLRACTTRLAPGGLLFLTVDYWDAEGPDTAHFSWMRARIYNRETLDKVLDYLHTLGCERFGGADRAYHGHHLFGSYTFCSLAVIKRGTPCPTPPAV